MAWENPKTNWGQSGQTVPIADDFNRIEGNILHLQDTKETPAGAQAKANTAEANAKAYTNAHEQKAAPHSGHETPAGAQAKAEAAAGAVQAQLDAHKAESATTSQKGHVQLSSSISSTSTSLAATASAVRTVNNSLNNHISSIGTTANYGHVKTINALTQTSHVDGTALSAYQGKVLKDLIDAPKGAWGEVVLTNSINAKATLNVNIPIGSSKSGVIASFRETTPSTNYGAVLYVFGTTAFNFSSTGSSDQKFTSTDKDAFLFGSEGTGEIEVNLVTASINGSNLVLTFKNENTSAKSLNARVRWGAW
jgi:hypothetical protein